MPDSPTLSDKEPIPGYVYVLERDDGHVKLGCSAHVEDRLNSIRTQAGILQGRVHVSPPCINYREGEALLHASFEKHRWVGEWFTVTFDEAVRAVQSLELIPPPGRVREKAGNPPLRALSVENLSQTSCKIDWCGHLIKNFSLIAKNLGYRGKHASDYIKERLRAVEGFEDFNREMGFIDLTTVGPGEIPDEQFFQAIREGDLAFFIELVEALPPSEDVASVIKRWRAAAGRACRVPRDELYVIYTYLTGNTTRSAPQFGRLCGRHGLKTYSVRTNDKVGRGIRVRWQVSEQTT